jgi:hypothetical protein
LPRLPDLLFLAPVFTAHEEANGSADGDGFVEKFDLKGGRV